MALTKITGQVINDTTGLVVGVTTVGGGISATDGFFSGIVTAVGNASFSGNVSVGGTLTYEDVTNIDAVGLITARNGIVVGSGITLSKDGDVFFTGIATGNGSGLTALNASNLASGTVPSARLGSGTASSSTFLAGDSTFKTVTGTTINNNADNRVITGSGTANTLEGESELNYSKESTTQHMFILGGTDDTASAWSATRQGFKAIGTQPLLYLVDSDNTSGDDAYVGHAGGVLYVAKRGGKLAFQTAASGGSTTNRWTVESDGHMLPAANNTYDIGSSSYRVRNIYTADLHCSNKGSSNDVDGTWGDYTIQEGESDLFLINNRNGKKYKFNLTEVS